MTVSTTSIPTAHGVSTRTHAIVLVAGAVITVAANTVIAVSAIAAGASAEFHPLMFVIFAPLTLVGYFAAYLGWRIVRSRAANPAAVLRVLVPVLGIASFIPDVVLLATGFVPGASLTAVIALALMHLVVIATIVPIALRIAPVR
ncbi:hypothetical protein [uncultured Microbacterium sp.]|uniref:hypothetical protein n=1 Tax=uncultured Microbacterium sp. TaxID=191216 RepID=UPI0035CC49DF